MKFFARLLVVSCAFSLCKSLVIKNSKACDVIRKSLGPHSCYSTDESLTFLQSSEKLGQTVTFFRVGAESLRILCHSDTEIQLKKLPSLNFREVNSIELEQCSLSDVSVLTKIKESFQIAKVKTLKVKSIRTKDVLLSKELFKSVAEVENLELETNVHVAFASDVFESTRNLKSAKLLVHDIIDLPYNVFEPLTKLETLWVASSGRKKNETKTLNFTMSWSMNLKHFHLSDTRWPLRIDKLLVSYFPLETISIVNNRIQSLSERTFNGSTSLEEIDLSNNKLTSLPRRVFGTQRWLATIDLSKNLLEALNDELFENNTDLELINLSHNKLKSASR